MKYLFTVLFYCFSATVFAQQGFLFEQTNAVKLVIGGDTLMHSWVGGLNAPVFSTIDLNQDGREDLFIFDRETNRVNTFVADNASGTWQWKSAPEFEALFPEELSYWVLLRDFDNDGKKDLFTVMRTGMDNFLVVFKNVTPPQGRLTFGPPRFLWNAAVSPVDKILISPDMLPSISDLDNDGDLDVLTFCGNNNNTICHFKGISKDNFGHADSLLFSEATQNWGGITRCSAPGVCNAFAFQGYTSCRINGTNHAGSGNILALDLDHDQDKDLLIGEDMCSSLSRFTNFGTATTAAMTPVSLQTNFPPNTTTAVFDNYPAAYYEDLNFDGKKDLLAAPFVLDNRVDKVNMSNTAWFYENTAASAATAPVFSYVQNNFLQAEMLELGESARPVFADVDADGDQDLLIGNFANMHNKRYKSTVSLFENVGSVSKPVFKLTNSDYLRFSQDNLRDIKLQFGDLNGDGSKDLILKYVEGNGSFIKFILNSAAANQPFQFSKSNLLNLGLTTDDNDSPFFYDLDGDGDLDLLLGTNAGGSMNPPSGAIRYYRRTGANAGSYQSWQLENADLGGIPQDLEHKDLQPFITDMNNDGQADLLTVSNSGRLEVYSDIMSNLNGTFLANSHTVFNSIRNHYLPSRFGLSLYAAVADLNADQKPEVIIGTRAGGAVFLQNKSTVQLGLPETKIAELNLQLYPNPTAETLNITAAEKVLVSVLDATGREILKEHEGFKTSHQVNVAHLKPGLYFLKVLTENHRSGGRTFIVSR